MQKHQVQSLNCELVRRVLYNIHNNRQQYAFGAWILFIRRLYCAQYNCKNHLWWQNEV